MSRSSESHVVACPSLLPPTSPHPLLHSVSNWPPSARNAPGGGGSKVCKVSGREKPSTCSRTRAPLSLGLSSLGISVPVSPCVSLPLTLSCLSCFLRWLRVCPFGPAMMWLASVSPRCALGARRGPRWPRRLLLPSDRSPSGGQMHGWQRPSENRPPGATHCPLGLPLCFSPWPLEPASLQRGDNPPKGCSRRGARLPSRPQSARSSCPTGPVSAAN